MYLRISPYISLWQALLRVGGAPWWHRLHLTLTLTLALALTLALTLTLTLTRWHRLHAALGPSLKPMAQHPTANFVLQALLESAPRYIPPVSPLYLPYISPISPLYLP